MIKKTSDYELLPHDKIEALRGELAKLKGERPRTHTSDTADAMQKLTETLDQFMELLQGAISEMKIEEREEELIANELRPLHEKLDQLLDQNQKIAQGVVAVADMLRKEAGKPSFPLESPPQLFGNEPQMGRMVPPPPPLPQKRGLF